MTGEVKKRDRLRPFFQAIKRSTDRNFQPQLDPVQRNQSLEPLQVGVRGEDPAGQRLLFLQAGDIQCEHDIHVAGGAVMGLSLLAVPGG